MQDKPINNWYLQKETIRNIYTDGYGPVQGHRTFWDSYLHAGCELILESDVNPFKDSANG